MMEQAVRNALEQELARVNWTELDTMRVMRRVQAMERERIVRVLSECMGSREKAAAKLGISKTTLWRKLRQYQII